MQTSVAKTNTRYAAGPSFHAVIHFIPTLEEECDIRNDLKGVSKETRQLCDLLTDSRSGIPVYVVRPELVTSTDDSSVSIFEGHSFEPDVFLSQKSHVQQKEQIQFTISIIAMQCVA